MSIFGKKSVPGTVRTEIEKRQGKSGYTWAAKRFPWIELTSMSSGCGKQLSSIKGGALYEGGSNRPNPIVTNVKVTKQGELGTTKKATVSFTAFTDEQITALERCYFIMGMSCRVEWGWSISATGAGAPGTIGGQMEDTKAICQINQKAAGSPHYSGIQGLISHFSYGLKDGNQWDCTVEIIAASEAVGGTKINEYSCNCARKYESEEPAGGEKKKTVENKSSLATMFHDLHDDFDAVASSYKSALTAVCPNATITKYNYAAPQRDEAGTEHTTFWEDWVPFNDPDAYDGYISWATLEAAITTMCIPSKNKQYTLGSLKSPNTLIAGHPQVNSSDPRICVIPGSSKSNIVSYESGDQPASAISGDKVLLDNIMINTIFLGVELKAVEDGDNNLRTFITNVLRKINECCGGLWELDTVNNSTDCLYPVLSVVDTKPFEAGGPFVIPGNASNSIIRDMKLDLKMTDAMKTQAVYSNGAKTTAKTDSGGNCGSEQIKKAKGGIQNLGLPEATTPPDCICDKVPSPKAENPSFDEVFENMKDDVNDASCRACHAALVEAYGKGGDQQCKGMVLPFEFSITVDGIGGFEFGQVVTCDRIPEAQRNGYDWQVTAVEHNVTPQDWTTTINTVARFKG